MVIKRRSQSIVEYLLISGVLVIVMIFGARNMASKAQRQYITTGKIADETANVLADGFGVGHAHSVADPQLEDVKIIGNSSSS